jgi:hypothetical protein
MPFKLSPGIAVQFIGEFRAGFTGDIPKKQMLVTVPDVMAHRCRYVGVSTLIPMYPDIPFILFKDPETGLTFGQAQPEDGQNVLSKVVGTTETSVVAGVTLQSDTGTEEPSNNQVERMTIMSDEKTAAEKTMEEKAEKVKKEKKPAIVLEKANGITRPRPESATGRVWAIADELSAAAGKPAPRKDVMTKGVAEGINQATIATQYGKWRKFFGLKAEPRPAPEVKTEKSETAAA